MPVRISLLEPDDSAAAIPDLADLLVDCVAGGASVGFLDPLPADEAAQWWQGTLGSTWTLTWVARDEVGSIVGCIRLELASKPNAAHRAEVSKLLVHRQSRRQGVARMLLRALEAEASERGRTLLMLDTESGSAAETLYLADGWTAFGIVPDHARRPDGQLAATTFMIKTLS